MEILLLATENAKSNYLLAVVQTAIMEMKLPIEVKILTETKEIENFGKVKLPAIVLDSVIIVEGRVPTVKEMKGILMQNNTVA